MAVQKLFWIFSVIQFFNSGNALQFTNLPATVSVAVGTTGEIFKARTDAPQGSIVFYLVPPSPASTYFNMAQSSGAVSVKSGVTLQPGTYTFTNIIPLIIPAIRGPAETLTIQVSDSTPPPSLFSQETYFAFPNSNTVNTQVFGPAFNFVTNPSPASIITYSLDTTTNSQYFYVNPSTGNIVLSQNYNVAALGDGLTLVLRATSTEGYEDTANIVVKIPNVSNLPAIPNLPNVMEVPENSPINTLIYTVNPPAVNGIPVIVTFTMTQSPATPSNLFSINPSTGQITTNAEIDYETVTTKTFMLEITATDFSGKSSMSTLTVSVLDVNEPPMLTPTSYNITTTPGPIGQIIIPETILSAVVDPDANDTTSFQLLGGNNSQYFTVNPTTGEISYAIDNSLNTIPSPVKLQVLINDKEFAYIIVNFNIIIETNIPPSFLNLPQNITIPQSQTAGLTFFTAIASDPDSTGPLTYSLPPTFPENLFTIDPTNGALSLKFSDTLVGLPSPVTIDVTVADGTDVTTGTLTLTVSTDLMLSNLPATVTIPVTQAPGVKFFTLSATNPNGNSLFYFLNPSSNPQNMFFVDVSTGDISVGFGNSLSSLPLTTTSVDLKVAVADGNDAVNDVLTIIIDRNTSNTAPIFTNLPTTKMIPNSTPQNTVVFTAVASDPGDSLTYSLGGPHTTFFTINPTSGAISATMGFQFFPVNTVLSLQVIASDGSLSVTETLNLTIVNSIILNVAPVINNLPTTKQTITNTTPIGTSVFTVDATDSNVGDVLTYSLSGIAAPLFAINSNSGVITTMAPMSGFTATTDLSLEVTVTDGSLSTTQPLTITIIPTSTNVAPVINNLPTTKQTIINTTPIGTLVFTVDATDSNGDVLTYSLDGPGSSAFFINSNSGEITAMFDFTIISAPTDVNLKVTVTDGLLSTTQPITITIIPTSINVAPVINNLPTTKQTIINTTQRK